MENRPTLEEVRRYAAGRRSNVNPEEFWIRYQKNGWTIGGQPIRNWMAIFDAWSQREADRPKRELIHEPEDLPEEDDPEERAAIIADIRRTLAIMDEHREEYRRSLETKARRRQ